MSGGAGAPPACEGPAADAGLAAAAAGAPEAPAAQQTGSSICQQLAVPPGQMQRAASLPLPGSVPPQRAASTPGPAAGIMLQQPLSADGEYCVRLVSVLVLMLSFFHPCLQSSCAWPAVQAHTLKAA